MESAPKNARSEVLPRCRRPPAGSANFCHRGSPHFLPAARLRVHHQLPASKFLSQYQSVTWL